MLSLFVRFHLGISAQAKCSGMDGVWNAGNSSGEARLEQLEDHRAQRENQMTIATAA